MRSLLSHFNSINTDNYYCTRGIGQELVTKHTLIYCHTLLLVEVSNYALGGWAGGGSVFHLEQFIESACIHRQVHMTYYHLTILNYLDTFEFSSCIWCNALECDGTIFFAPTAFYKLDDSATNFNCKKGNNITEQAVQEAPRPSLSHTLV